MTSDHTSSVLFTDQYQLTMSQLYFREGIHTREARFDYFFRSYPDYGAHRAGYCVFAGSGPLLEWMSRVSVSAEDVEWLRVQKNVGGVRRFADDFLEWLEAEGSFARAEIRGVSEGRVVHPNEPILTVQGPLAVVQLLETPLLNRLNYPTLIATKAARMAHAARGRPVLEFGTRRGPAGGAAAGVRAALIGGAEYTSNVAVSQRLGLDPKGTHAHAMVQAFMARGDDELDAFRAYARVYPDECLLLVDTVDTLESGLPNAIKVFEELRAAGHEPVGVRLDSGDLARLTVAAARQLESAGFGDTSIVLSSDLDELEIGRIVAAVEAAAVDEGFDPAEVIGRLAFGVGTRLITSHGSPALGGVFKLVALERDGEWRPALKRSDTPAKTPVPGIKAVWRLYDERGTATADVVGRRGEEPAVAGAEPLHEALFSGGSPVRGIEDLDELRRRRAADVARLPAGTLELVDPEPYNVELTEGLAAMLRRLLGDDDAGVDHIRDRP